MIGFMIAMQLSWMVAWLQALVTNLVPWFMTVKPWLIMLMPRIFA